MLAASVAALVLLASPQKSDVDAARIDKLTGATGAAGADGSYRVSVPRSELDVYAGQIQLTPAMGLTAWADFKRADKGTLVVGELVLLEEQIAAAEAAAVAGGLEVSAVDHHYTGESPRVVFVHFTGVGDEAAMATAVGKTFEAVKAKAAGAGPKLATLETAHKPLDAARLQAALPGGKLVDGVYQFSRARPVKVHGQAVGAEQGAASHADIAGSDDAAAVSGAFAAQGAEVQALLKAAAAQGLTVTSLDAPFANDAPHLVLVHFWGTGPSDKLARAVATGLAILK